MKYLKSLILIVLTYLRIYIPRAVFFNKLASSGDCLDVQVDGYVQQHKEKKELIKFLKDELIKIIKQHLSASDKVLDFGCGTGRYLKELEQVDAYDLHGTDISKNTIDNYASKRLSQSKLFALDIFKNKKFLSENEQSFDLIYSITVLEYIHPYDIGNLFKKLASLLKAKGKLILQFPLPNDFFDRYGYGYFRYPAIMVEKVLRKNGFKIIQSSKVSELLSDAIRSQSEKINVQESPNTFGHLIVAQK